MRRLIPTRQARRRLLAINAVLTRRGLSWLAEELRVPRLRRMAEPVNRSELTAESLRLTLEELGTTFIKFGQVLSTRPDLLSSEYITELQKLQDNVGATPYPAMELVFIQELGHPPAELFQSFTSVPRAAASIGQVYDAVMLDGTEIVVKIQRPGVAAQCAEDVEILRDFARLFVRSSIGERVDLIGAVEEFAASLERELDFRVEAHNAERIRKNFEGDPVVKIPKIFAEFSTERVLTEERITGIRIDDMLRLGELGFDRHELAERCCHILLSQIFEHRFFHADPHPGNFFVLPNGAIAMIDFGMVGRIDAKTRDTLAKLIPAIAEGDADDLADSLLELGLVQGRVDRLKLVRDLQRLVDDYTGKPLGEISLAAIATKLVETMRRNSLQFPSNLLLLIRVISIDEGTARNLDPTFQLTEYAAPYFRRFWAEQLSPSSIAKQQAKNTLQILLGSRSALQRVSRLVSSLERGDFTVRANIGVIEGPNEDLRAAARLIARAILMSGLLLTAGLLWIGSRIHR